MRVDERLLGIYDISVMHSYGVDRVDVFKHVDNSYKGVINMDNRLKEIRERLGKARKSPWEVNGSRICDCPLCDGEGQVDYADISGDGWVALAQTYGIGSMIFNNADFIANSPADMQFLLDIIDGQQRQLEDRLEAQTDACLNCSKIDAFMFESENELLKQKLGIANNLVDAYQKEIIPGFRDRAELLEKSQLQPAKKFMKNSIVKQLHHMQSEFNEVLDEVNKDFVSPILLAMEVIDLQMSCQTFLEGAMGLTKEQISTFIAEVKAKNDARKYNESE